MSLTSLIRALGGLTRLDPSALDRQVLRGSVRIVMARGMSEEMALDVVRAAYKEPMSDQEKAIANVLVRSVARPGGGEAQEVLRLSGYCDCGDNRSKDGKCIRCSRPVVA